MASILTIVSSATPTINTDNYDTVNITAQAVAITSFTSSLSGTPSNFDHLMIRITDDNGGGAPYAINWGSKFASSGRALLPTSTSAGAPISVFLIYDSVKAKWICMAVDDLGY